jgi:CheY-like chemotaxis protein
MRIADLRKQFGAAVRSKRCELGITQEELADRAGLHRTYISDVERGARNISLACIDRLARALEYSLPMLFQCATAEAGSVAPEMVEILLVEDDPNDVELTMRAFARARISNPLRVARDGEEALQFIFGPGGVEHRRTAFPARIVLLDLNLPKTSGLKVLRRIRSDPRTRGIPVVVLTVSDASEDITECQRLGVEHYIVKPVNFSNFSEVASLLKLDWALLALPHGGDAADEVSLARP